MIDRHVEVGQHVHINLPFCHGSRVQERTKRGVRQLEHDDVPVAGELVRIVHVHRLRTRLGL
jgi:hypothetical protein